MVLALTIWVKNGTSNIPKLTKNYYLRNCSLGSRRIHGLSKSQTCFNNKLSYQTMKHLTYALINKYILHYSIVHLVPFPSFPILFSLELSFKCNGAAKVLTSTFCYTSQSTQWVVNHQNRGTFTATESSCLEIFTREETH